MDTKSIMFFFGIISSCIGILFLAFIIINKKKNLFLAAFTISKFFQAIGVFCYSYRYSIPDYISLNLGSSFLLLGYALEIFCVLSYDNIYRRAVLYSILIPVIIIFAIILFFFRLSYNDLAKVFYLGASYLFAFGAYSLFRKKDKTNFVILVSLSYLVFSVSWMANIILLFVYYENYPILSGKNIFELIHYTFAALNLIIGSVGYLMILKELDEQNIAEKNKIIEADNIQLKELNNKKDKFFSIIAHDLKSPIGALSQLGQVLLESQSVLPEKEKEDILNTISKAARNTYNLLENLLQWSRTETGKIVVKSTKLNIKKITDGALKLLKENINQKKITIKNDIMENIYAFGDPNMINTIIRNLISNAIKYVHEKGNISLSSEIDMHEYKVIIDISDDGVGIAQEIIKRLFDIDNEYTTKGTNNESGTGLGLKLCKEFITMNRGEIKVASEIGKGSSFKVILPMADKTATNKRCYEKH